jgi:hypothetical protein
MKPLSYFFAVLIVALSIAGIVQAVLGRHAAPAAPVVTQTPVSTSSPTQATTPPTPLQPEVVATTTLIRKVTPLPETRVSSPLSITGEARGMWYFEASFPVELLDANGVVISQGIAQAQGDWMTENFVPFTATLSWASTTSATGTLRLKKDNPSGLPEHDASLLIPVVF